MYRSPSQNYVWENLKWTVSIQYYQEFQVIYILLNNTGSVLDTIYTVTLEVNMNNTYSYLFQNYLKYALFGFQDASQIKAGFSNFKLI